MKKSILLIIMVTSIFACGCSGNPEKTGIETEAAASPADTENKTGEENVQLPDSVNKYEIKYKEFEADTIASMLLGKKVHELEVTTEKNEYGTNYYYTENGVAYSWSKGEDYFTYYRQNENDETEGGSVDESQAHKIADDMMIKLGEELDLKYTSPEVRIGENDCEYTYVPTYDDIPSIGNQRIFYGDDDSFGGEFVSINVDKSGIRGLYIFGVVDVKEIKKSYQPQKEFLTADEALEKINMYEEILTVSSYIPEEPKVYKLDDFEEITLKYMPYYENGDFVLVPVYGVRTKDMESGKNTILMDAITGYIYN